MTQKNIGETLKALRAASKKTVSEIVQELKDKHEVSIAQSTLYGYENGHSIPNVDVFLALCVIYDCQDILYTFGYANKGNTFIPVTEEDIQILEKYHSLPFTGRNMILGALGVESDIQKSAKIS